MNKFLSQMMECSAENSTLVSIQYLQTKLLSVLAEIPFTETPFFINILYFAYHRHYS